VRKYGERFRGLFPDWSEEISDLLAMNIYAKDYDWHTDQQEQKYPYIKPPKCALQP